MDVSTVIQELEFKASRSSGPGGQHVNKVSTKIEVKFDLLNSDGLSKEEKERISKKLRSRLTSAGILKIQSQASRSQYKNRQDAQAKILKVLQAALIVQKKRKPTKPSKKAKEKRLKEKKIIAAKKASRSKPIDF